MGLQAKWAYGTTLTRAGNTIAELDDIGAPRRKADALDATTHDSANGYRDFIGGLRDGGEVSLKGNFYPGDTLGQIGLRDDLDAGTLQVFVLTFPAAMAATETFNGIVTSLETGAPLAGKVPFTATIKVSGKPVLGVTLSAGAASITGIEENLGGAIAFDPTYAIGTFAYGTLVNTASTWVKLTVTAAAHTITITCGTQSQTVASGVQSGPITLGAADTLTVVNVNVKEVNKVAKDYKFYVSRP